MTPLRKNRDFQLLWAGQAISVLGSRITSIAYPLLVLAMTGSPAIAGLVGFIGQVPYILFQLPAGVVMDRVNRRRLMIACDAGRMLALLSIPIAGWVGHLSLGQVLVVAFVEGSLFVFFRLGEVSAVRALVIPAHYPSALAQNEARARSANMLGNAIGGFLFDLGRTVPFLADAISYVFSLVTLLLIRKPFEEARSGERRRMFAEIREGVDWLLSNRYTLVVNLAASATNGFFQIVYLVVIVAERQRGRARLTDRDRAGRVWRRRGVGLACRWLADAPVPAQHDRADCDLDVGLADRSGRSGEQPGPLDRGARRARVPGRGLEHRGHDRVLPARA